MIKQLTLSRHKPYDSIQQAAPFEKINFIAARQLVGMPVTNPIIMVSVGEGVDVFSLSMNLNPLTNEFKCVDVLAAIRKMNVLPDFMGNNLKVSINENYYQDQFSIELAVELL